jgi:hypothetical protein
MDVIYGIIIFFGKIKIKNNNLISGLQLHVIIS